jgi:hypothetical protein
MAFVIVTSIIYASHCGGLVVAVVDHDDCGGGAGATSGMWNGRWLALDVFGGGGGDR